MSDIKISCPNCGQHIACGPEYAGRQVACPNCQTPMVVPGTPAVATVVRPIAASPVPPRPPASAPSPAAPPPPPPPPPSPPPMAASPMPGPPPRPAATHAPRPLGTPAAPAPGASAGGKRTSGLAIASLVCSILSCVGGFIPGIICGHLARARMRKDPTLGGAGLATAGLWIGYIILGLNVVWFILTLAGVVSFGDRVFPGSNRPRSNTPTLPSGRNQSGSPAAAPGTDMMPERLQRPRTAPRTGIAYREPKLPMPENPVAGKVGPAEFKYEHAILQAGWLTLRQGQEFMADAEVVITLFASSTSLEGKTIRVSPGNRGGTVPHVRAKWKVDGSQKTEVVMSDYTMTLTFEKIVDGKIQGAIDLELPGKADTKIKGNFNATVK